MRTGLIPSPALLSGSMRCPAHSCSGRDGTQKQAAGFTRPPDGAAVGVHMGTRWRSVRPGPSALRRRGSSRRHQRKRTGLGQQDRAWPYRPAVGGRARVGLAGAGWTGSQSAGCARSRAAARAGRSAVGTPPPAGSSRASCCDGQNRASETRPFRRQARPVGDWRWRSGGCSCRDTATLPFAFLPRNALLRPGRFRQGRARQGAAERILDGFCPAA